MTHFFCFELHHYTDITWIYYRYNQIRSIIPSAKKIDIAVPYFDNGCSAVKELAKQYDSAMLTLFVQNKKARIPIERISNNKNIITLTNKNNML